MIKVKDLRDLVDAKVSVTVSDPVPTLRGPDKLDPLDDVEIEIGFGPGIVVRAVVTAELYMNLQRAVAERKRIDAEVV